MQKLGGKPQPSAFDLVGNLNLRSSSAGRSTRSEARGDAFDYIEVFYNRQRRHGRNGGVPPMIFEASTSKR